jgi:capsular polysaccharide biosynthesis protein
MSDIQKNYSLDNFEDVIELKEILKNLWQEKWTIISITTFISIIGLIYSLLLPNIYESRAILNPANSGSGISRSLQNYSGLAGLAGVSIPSGDDNSNSTKAIEKLNTLSFFENSIFPNIFLPDLMAHDSWNNETNVLRYNDNIYDTKNKRWIRHYSYPLKQIPSAQESFKEFKDEHFRLSEDKKTGFITISIRHKSPFIAKKWTELIVNEINNFYREKDKEESEKTVNYLNKQIAITNFSEVKEAISKLLQEETKKLALIEAKQLYVFEYIDPPALMEKKSEPQRALILFISFLFGGILGIIYVLTRKYFLD